MTNEMSMYKLSNSLSEKWLTFISRPIRHNCNKSSRVKVSFCIIFQVSSNWCNKSLASIIREIIVPNRYPIQLLQLTIFLYFKNAILSFAIKYAVLNRLWSSSRFFSRLFFSESSTLDFMLGWRPNFSDKNRDTQA